MGRRWRSWAVLTSLLVASPAPAPAAAGARTLHLRFARVPTLGHAVCGDVSDAAGAMLTDSARLLLGLATPRGCSSSELLVVNVQSGRRRLIHVRGGGSPVAIGGGWILFDSPYRLFDLATGRWRPLSCGYACEPAETINAFYAVGRRWVEMTFQQAGSCGDNVHSGCGPTTTAFYDIARARIAAPAGKDSSHVYDLSAPSGVSRLCAPLQDPDGTLILLGRYALAGAQYGDAYTGSSPPTTLEQCGTKLAMPIADDANASPGSLFLASTHAVIWGESDGSESNLGIAGVLLGSLQRFHAAVPDWLYFDDATNVGLLGRRLYGIDGRGRLEVATLPAR